GDAPDGGRDGVPRRRLRGRSGRRLLAGPRGPAPQLAPGCPVDPADGRPAPGIRVRQLEARRGAHLRLGPPQTPGPAPVTGKPRWPRRRKTDLALLGPVLLG